ncbi:uncharacterized protein BX664DRAFT_134299 [Halteromyces radiatus]|uniref:uncharacterized protein n=1 Tax=Halteromyces radiatus TaxID=101107 RepID=UPI00221E3A5E|nr:uncharacterized protein BX664DRAFT_134299 [Halteromyces radiatus]KAI8089444.1 hypothetical protein BX664DRAFT_134299 [Halteromyces radiatus]
MMLVSSRSFLYWYGVSLTLLLLSLEFVWSFLLFFTWLVTLSLFPFLSSVSHCHGVSFEISFLHGWFLSFFFFVPPTWYDVFHLLFSPMALDYYPFVLWYSPFLSTKLNSFGFTYTTYKVSLVLPLV